MPRRRSRRSKTKRVITAARLKAKAAKLRGLEFHLHVERNDFVDVIEIDVTVLAHVETWSAAKMWIDGCVRSIIRLDESFTVADQARTRQALWGFWKGD